MNKPEKPPVYKGSTLVYDIIDELMKKKAWESLNQLDLKEYCYWEDLKHKIKTWKVTPEKVWWVIKYRRGFSSQTINLGKRADFIFQYNIPGFLQKDLHELDMNLGGSLQSENLIPAEEKNRYLVSSIMEEAIASSQLEGAVTTRKVARDMLEKERKPQNKSELMIFNNYQTMKWIVENKDVSMTRDVLLSIHKLITYNTLDKKEYEGQFRFNNNIKIVDETNEVFYDPPSYKHLEWLLKQFCHFANDESGSEKVFVHPLIKGIILHFLIGYIHPFTDGNGRTARALFYWYLIKKGYWLTEYMSISRIILKGKSQYARAYLHTEYDDNDLTYFILYNIRCIRMALDELKKYIQKKTLEKKQTLALLKDSHFNERQVVIIKDVFQERDQYFTVRQIESRFNVSNQTARNDLIGLVNKGILEQRVKGKKALFYAEPDFEEKLNIKK